MQLTRALWVAILLCHSAVAQRMAPLMASASFPQPLLFPLVCESRIHCAWARREMHSKIQSEDAPAADLMGPGSMAPYTGQGFRQQRVGYVSCTPPSTACPNPIPPASRVHARRKTMGKTRSTVNPNTAPTSKCSH